jgi:hypothetical protein
MLTHDFRGFTHSVKEHAGILLRRDSPNASLSSLFQFFIYILSYNSTRNLI